ncbi:hypothetical protein [Metaclostridioides mangenotii]|uniref:hypothetical protein n=1 Tax=Metaclostridioides mangenotii TaxID=1540 RepID=UPI0028E95924|nr:hypothetical protein [Clostridioides mangenotii]
MNQEIDFKQICIDLGADIIDPERNYWFVRTKGGRFYSDFYNNEYIAIGWNKVNLSRADNRKEKVVIEEMKQVINSNYPDEKVAGKPAGQIYRFVKKMKSGDIVLVPNSDTKSILFGEILEDNIFIEEIKENNKDDVENALLYNTNDLLLDESVRNVICPFEKRRKIKWIKEIDRYKLDSSLYSLLNSHGAVSGANKYSYSIDRELSSFYIKGEKAHIVQRITTKEDIPAIDLLNFVYNNLKFIDIYNEIFDEDISKNDVNMKLNVQSPGLIDFQGSIVVMGIIGLLGIFFGGGNIKIKKGSDGSFEFEMSSNGVLKQALDHIQFKIKNSSFSEEDIKEELRESQEKLQIESPFMQNNSEIVITSEIDEDVKLENNKKEE